MNNIDDKADIYFYDLFLELINIKKLIDNGIYLCFNINFFEKLNKIMYIKPVTYTYIAAADYTYIADVNYTYDYGDATTYKDAFIDNSIDDDCIKIFLGKDDPYSNHKGWSPSVPIGKVENLLKLKAFI